MLHHRRPEVIQNSFSIGTIARHKLE
jgi:hypothetical protein